MYNLYDLQLFDLYAFDLDGTLFDTEKLHHIAYNDAFKYFNLNIELNYDNYCKIAHKDNIQMKMLIEDNNIIYDEVYKYKKKRFLELLENVNFIPGAEKFLNDLIKLKIKICIVTHSDNDVLKYIRNKFPILDKIDLILTKNDYLNKKPDPECYLKALSLFPECTKPIGFEDSYKGYLSLYETPITPVFINNNDYIYIKKLNIYNIFEDFTNIELNNIIIKQNHNLNNFIENSFIKYQNGINILKNNIANILEKIIPLIKNCKNNIYITGIGKCGHICQKTVSTWKSLGLSCNFLYIPDLFHGDFGILKNGDIILYISNSGNTEEIINATKYIKNNFNIIQICISFNKSGLIKEFVDFYYYINNKIYEIGSINMAPTVSSVLFMIILDILGTKISEDNGMTIEKFKKYHPGGDLGKKNNDIIDYIVIVASGEGTRLKPLTSFIPKILVTINNKIFIETLIEYWQKICNNIIIINNSKYNDLIKFYTKNYCNITILNYDDTNGTAHTINSVINKTYYDKNILFTWCDIIPIDNLKFDNIDTNIIFTHGNESRYGISNNKIVKKNDGNIIGLYYIKNYKGFHNYIIGQDICDIFDNNYSEFNTYKIKNLLDIGDISKLTSYIYSKLNDKYNTRFFNSISLSEHNTLIKKSIHLQGNQIIKNEINWYKHIHKHQLNFIPMIYKIDTFEFEMEKINGEPLYLSFNKFDDNKKINILNNIFNKLENLHNLEKLNISYEILEKDIYLECYEKIIIRINKIKDIINYFGDIKYVNNIFIKDKIDDILKNILNNIFNYYKNYDKYEYNIIHGDIQFSNLLYDLNKDEIFMIDPRGYFGTQKIFGDKLYDYSKILYALSGYDKFNNNHLFSIEYYNKNKGILLYNIENNLYLINNLENKYKDILNNKLVICYWIIIWFGLAQYNQNNILKCIVSYYNGIYYYYKYLA